MVADMLPSSISTSAGKVAAKLLLAFAALSAYTSAPVTASTPFPDDTYYAPGFAVLPPISTPKDGLGRSGEAKAKTLNFKLRHIFHHGTHKYPDLHRRLDVPAKASVWYTEDDSLGRQTAPQLRARSEPMNIQRLVDRHPATIDAILDAGRMNGKAVSLPASAWTVDEIPGPNVTDQETALSFARMASDAYILEPGTGEWQDVGGGFNYTEDFGWESDGLRGHIFADTKNSTVVIGLKGTSPAVFDGSETTGNDKINDNLFFSCCCAQGGQLLWKQVCDCQTSTYTCNSTCLVKALRNKNRYYYAAQDLYRNVTDLYPHADIWLTGHSLGGSTVSLLGLTVGSPVLTFEAPGEAMPAARLGLPTPPGYRVGAHGGRAITGGYHFGQTADPLFMGTCNAATSFCTIAGYAMQSVCHTGYTCTYDTVKDFGWRPGLGNHKIVNAIKMMEKYGKPAKCEPDVNCTDCYNWKYFESNGTDRTTTSSSSGTSTSTRTRTETCKTPGWWGCLDESTTTTGTTTKSSSTSTSTCKTPGWFGCKDPTTTTTSSSSSTQATPAPTASLTSPTTSCEHPGWFGGCYDSTSQRSTKAPHTAPITSTVPSSRPSTTTSSTTCTSKEWFGLICVDPSPVETAPASTSSVPSVPTSKSARCAERHWYGPCKEWQEWKYEI